MICAMTVRRIADGQADEFLDRFGGGADSIPPEIRDRFKAVYACRDVSDSNKILTFGLFDGTIDEFRDLQSQDRRSEQLDAIAPLVEETLFDGSFEVITDFVAAQAGSRA